jgi:hypothetical protein
MDYEHNEYSNDTTVVGGYQPFQEQHIPEQHIEQEKPKKTVHPRISIEPVHDIISPDFDDQQLDSPGQNQDPSDWKKIAVFLGIGAGAIGGLTLLEESGDEEEEEERPKRKKSKKHDENHKKRSEHHEEQHKKPKKKKKHHRSEEHDDDSVSYLQKLFSED